MILHGDALDQSMFWVGAMFAFTPVIIAGTVVAVWWRGHKRSQPQPPTPDGHDPGSV